MVNRTRATLLAERAYHATHPWSRMRGLLGTAALARGEGIVIEPCHQVHTLLMRYPIDVVFTAHDGRVVALVEALGPWRVTSPHPSARRAVELPVGTVAATRTARGDLLLLEPLEAPCGSS